jgi:hypothetical protein
MWPDSQVSHGAVDCTTASGRHAPTRRSSPTAYMDRVDGKDTGTEHKVRTALGLADHIVNTLCSVMGSNTAAQWLLHHR